MKKKKGLLLAETTVKVIIALLCISFLAVLLYTIYQHTQGNQDLDLAKSSLDFFVSQVKDSQPTVTIYNPEGWNINTWPQEISGGGVLGFGNSQSYEMPVACQNFGWSKCICICPKTTRDSCEAKGYCLNNGDDIVLSGNNLQLKNLPLTLKINYAGEKAEVSTSGS